MYNNPPSVITSRFRRIYSYLSTFILIEWLILITIYITARYENNIKLWNLLSYNYNNISNNIKPCVSVSLRLSNSTITDNKCDLNSYCPNDYLCKDDSVFFHSYNYTCVATSTVMNCSASYCLFALRYYTPARIEFSPLDHHITTSFFETDELSESYTALYSMSVMVSTCILFVTFCAIIPILYRSFLRTIKNLKTFYSIVSGKCILFHNYVSSLINRLCSSNLPTSSNNTIYSQVPVETDSVGPSSPYQNKDIYPSSYSTTIELQNPSSPTISNQIEANPQPIAVDTPPPSLPIILNSPINQVENVNVFSNPLQPISSTNIFRNLERPLLIRWPFNRRSCDFLAAKDYLPLHTFLWLTSFFCLLIFISVFRTYYSTTLALYHLLIDGQCFNDAGIIILQSRLNDIRLFEIFLFLLLVSIFLIIIFLFMFLINICTRFYVIWDNLILLLLRSPSSENNNYPH